MVHASGKLFHEEVPLAQVLRVAQAFEPEDFVCIAMFCEVSPGNQACTKTLVAGLSR